MYYSLPRMWVGGAVGVVTRVQERPFLREMTGVKSSVRCFLVRNFAVQRRNTDMANSTISPKVMAERPSQSPSCPPMSEIRFWDCGREGKSLAQPEARQQMLRNNFSIWSMAKENKIKPEKTTKATMKFWMFEYLNICHTCSFVFKIESF